MTNSVRRKDQSLPLKAIFGTYFMQSAAIKSFLISFILLLSPPLLQAQDSDNLPQRQSVEEFNQSGKNLLKFITDSLHAQKPAQPLNQFQAEEKLAVRGYAAQLTGIEDLDLPPLETFMESVYDNGSVKQRTAYKEQMEAEYKTTKNDWMDYLHFQADYAYGYYFNYNSYYSDYMPANSRNAQHRWSVGVNLSFSVADLVNRKHKVKADKARVDQALFFREEVIEERKLRILNAYNAILENLAVLKPRAETVALYNAQMKVSENDYINGKITIIDLSLERQRRSVAIVQYQQGRVALHNAVKSLELLTNIKIIKE